MSDETTLAEDDSASPFLTLTITPEPTDEERDGLVAALALLLSTSPSTPMAPKQLRSRWALAGRREAMRPMVR